jgi:pSer/pThr/pTyr-binding forkhead associated (FHA) protein
VAASEPGPTQGETTLVMPALPKLSTRPTLQIVSGEGEGTVFSLEQKTTVIGRGEDCDIVINHPLVSRHHAKIVRVGPSYYVHDLQSTNGTMVNSQRIDQHVLQPEDELQIGVTLMLFQQAKSE